MLLMNGLDLPSGEHTKNYRKVPAFIGESTIFAAILYSYVSFPEGKGNLQETMFFFCNFPIMVGKTQQWDLQSFS